MEKIDYPGVSPLQEIRISPSMKEDIIKGARWAQFLAILGFIGIGISLVVSVSFAFVWGNMVESLGSGPQSILAGPFMGIFYFIITLLYFFPVLFLFRYAAKSKRGVESNNQADIESAFKNLKRLFIFMGIYVIVLVCFYFLVIGGIMFINIGSLN